MKVSVLITTYNQESFIGQAVNSALMQEAAFNYEIVIVEDASTDRTREIVLEFAEKYPDKVRLLLRDAAGAQRDRANGVGGKGSFVNGLQECQGDYVALLDGDDYWIGAHKLQKQVDFLESHSEYALCHHNAQVLREDGAAGPATFCPPGQKKTSTLEDLLKGNFIFSGSTLFRRGLFGPWPDWFQTSKTGDWLLHVLNAQHGRIGYLDEVMAVYRVHAGSWWSIQPARARLIDQVKLLDQVNAHLGFKFNRTIKATQQESCATLAEMSYRRGDLIEARQFLAKSISCGLSNHRLPTIRQLGRLVKLYNPTLFKLRR